MPVEGLEEAGDQSVVPGTRRPSAITFGEGSTGVRLADSLPSTAWLRPGFGPQGRSTHAALGVVGYALASVLTAILAGLWELTLVERLLALLAPPVAFLAFVTIASRIAGRDWIVLYPIAYFAVAVVALAGFVLGARVPLLLDVTVLGIAAFVAVGRIGCLHRGCCHGRLGPGVTYGEPHVGLGIWPRLAGRSVLPVQLVESAGCVALVVGALVVEHPPGDAAILVATGYAGLRFVLELGRGDLDRGFFAGASDGQWGSFATAAICAAVRPSGLTLGTLGGLALGLALLALLRRHRELVLPPHLRELEEIFDGVLTDSRRRTRTSRLGVSVACAPLADGRIEWTLAASHRAWTTGFVRRLARLLWGQAEVVAGGSPGEFRIVVTPRWVTG